MLAYESYITGTRKNKPVFGTLAHWHSGFLWIIFELCLAVCGSSRYTQFASMSEVTVCVLMSIYDDFILLEVVWN